MVHGLYGGGKCGESVGKMAYFLSTVSVLTQHVLPLCTRIAGPTGPSSGYGKGPHPGLLPDDVAQYPPLPGRHDPGDAGAGRRAVRWVGGGGGGDTELGIEHAATNSELP